MITPVNSHLVIEPVKHETFIASDKETYEEIGVVVALPVDFHSETNLKIGDKVYFDSWLAAKYPKEDKEDEFYWLVKWEDIRAVGYVKS